MNYYIQDENEKIVLFDTNKETLQNTLEFMPQYADLEILQTNKKIIMLNGEFVFKDEVEDELTQKRKEEFENKFLTTSYGAYRLEPKGYANAQQTFDVIDKKVSRLGALTPEIATVVIFYETPDFSKEEQCTEEWLLQHQYNIEPMTKEEWEVLYDEFSLKYMQKMYQQQLREQQKQV